MQSKCECRLNSYAKNAPGAPINPRPKGALLKYKTPLLLAMNAERVADVVPLALEDGV
jgi:hypothetical protein